MTPYAKGQKDAQSGRIPSWAESANPQYMRGYNATYVDMYRPKKVWWWPF